MTRRNISLPDDLDERVRAAGLNVSALARNAILQELDRRARMAKLDEWLDELDEQHGEPSATDVANAEEWAESQVPVARRERRVAVQRATRVPAKKSKTKAAKAKKSKTRSPRSAKAKAATSSRGATSKGKRAAG